MVAPKKSRFCVSCLRCPPPHRMRDDLKGQACAHHSETCSKCWEEYIASQLEYLTPNHLACIECANPLTQADVRLLATPEDYSKYLDLELRFSLSNEESFHFCPSGDCKSGQFHDECGDIFECIECDYKHCLPCQRPWHPGLPCEEVQSKRKETAWKLENQFLKETGSGEETSLEEFIEVKSKPCPGCKRHIDQDGGCDHMTCSACDHEFCWVCLADYMPIFQNGYHFHKEDCEHWRDPAEAELDEAAATEDPHVVETEEQLVASFEAATRFQAVAWDAEGADWTAW